MTTTSKVPTPEELERRLEHTAQRYAQMWGGGDPEEEKQLYNHYLYWAENYCNEQIQGAW